MVLTLWAIREADPDPSQLKSIYDDNPSLFSFAIHHGGKFTKSPGRKYVQSKINYVDLVDAEVFSVHELNFMMKELGYEGKIPMYYYFLIPELSLDFGLQPLGNDDDVRNLCMHFYENKFKDKCIPVFIEHGKTVLDAYYKSPKSSKVRIEEIQEESMPKVKHGKRLMLEWASDENSEEPTLNDQTSVEGANLNDASIVEEANLNDQCTVEEPTLNDQTSVEGANLNDASIVKEANLNDQCTVEEPNLNEHNECYNVNLDPSAVQSNVLDQNTGYDHFSDILDDEFDPFFNSNIEDLPNSVVDNDNIVAETVEKQMVDGIDDDADEDFIVDEENIVDDVEVDMRDFRLNIDQEAEFMGINKALDDGNKALDDDESGPVVEMEVIDNDKFDSGSDGEGLPPVEKLRRKKLKEVQQVGQFTNEGSQNSCFFVSQTFGTRKEVISLIKRHAIETRRQLKIVKQDLVRVRAICEGSIPTFENDSQTQIDSDACGDTDKNKKGKAKACQESKEREVGGRGKKGNKHGGNLCPWVIHVSKLVDSETWMVKTLNEDHKCLQSRKIKACTSSFLATEIAEQIASNPSIPVRSIQEQLQRKLEVGVSKMKAFRAKAQASKQIKGDYESQYLLLRDYCLELQATNDGTTVQIEVEPGMDHTDQRVFKRIYVCLGALKQGFKAIGRDLLGLDGAFMKGPFPGILLTAVGLDPNNGIYPLAYAIVEAENFSSWRWFLYCIGEDLELSTRSNFTFISDRQKGILPAIAKVYPCAEHRYCVRHIHENMKLQWKGTAYKDLLWKCATSTTVQHFNIAMDELRSLNEGASKWLASIPPQNWSRSHFSGRAHSDVLLNNLCEVFNKQLVDGRDKPIITCLEYCREYLMKRIVNVLKVIDRCDGPLTPHATKVFDKIKGEASKYVVLWNGGNKYQVTGPWGDQCVVDIVDKSCSCRRWELTGMPCKHGVASIWNMALNGQDVGIPESFVDPLYRLDTWKKVYSFRVDPINGKSMWPKSRVPTVLLPPHHHTPVGRPKKQRRKTAEEVESMVGGGKLSKRFKSVKCGKCGNSGHNSRGCKGQGGSSSQGGSSVSQASSNTQASKNTQGKGKGKGPSVEANKKRKRG